LVLLCRRRQIAPSGCRLGATRSLMGMHFDVAVDSICCTGLARARAHGQPWNTPSRFQFTVGKQNMHTVGVPRLRSPNHPSVSVSRWFLLCRRRQIALSGCRLRATRSFMRTHFDVAIDSICCTALARERAHWQPWNIPSRFQFNIEKTEYAHGGHSQDCAPRITRADCARFGFTVQVQANGAQRVPPRGASCSDSASCGFVGATLAQSLAGTT
jgi:hypothetical protein